MWGDTSSNDSKVKSQIVGVVTDSGFAPVCGALMSTLILVSLDISPEECVNAEKTQTLSEMHLFFWAAHSACGCMSAAQMRSWML